VALVGSVIRVRDGGACLAAGAGERRCGGGPRRASSTLRQRAWAAAHRGRDSPPTPTANGANPRLSDTSLVIPRYWPEPGQGRTAWRAEGVPLTASGCCTFVLHQDQTPALLSREPGSPQRRNVELRVELRGFEPLTPSMRTTGARPLRIVPVSQSVGSTSLGTVVVGPVAAFWCCTLAMGMSRLGSRLRQRPTRVAGAKSAVTVGHACAYVLKPAKGH
jgi:hypothetical protein